jgi:hypothetical protein
VIRGERSLGCTKHTNSSKSAEFQSMAAKLSREERVQRASELMKRFALELGLSEDSDSDDELASSQRKQ